MQKQAGISLKKMRAKVGRRIEVLVDEVQDGLAQARSWADAPEIDGKVLVTNGGKLKPGQRAQVKVIGADTYDLHAEM